MWPDYDLNNPSTWTVMEAPTIDPSWEEALTRIGGVNPFGKPVLVWRWGATYRDPMALDDGLKYWLCNRERTLEGFEYTDPDSGQPAFAAKLEDVPKAVLVTVPRYSEPLQLGERRIIIEQWRSAEFLEHSGRYSATSTRDEDKTTNYILCRGCDAQLAVNKDPDGPCPNCGSTRAYLRSASERGEGRLLRTLPPEGVYDCFLRLENADGEPMEPDGHALKLIEFYWNKQQNDTPEQKIRETLAETADQEAMMRNATSPANPFVGPAVPGW